MKSAISLLLIFIFTFKGIGQAYLGTVTKQVNLREGSGTHYPVISTLGVGTQVFIISLETTNDFYNVVDISKDREGYVHKSCVKVGELIRKNNPGLFAPKEETTKVNPEIEIYNRTNLRLTLKLNENTYYFNPQEKRTIIILPGVLNYRASAPNLIPNIGTENIQNNKVYTWQFYIAN